ncbi:unnamed protein product [Peronospora belbahrii]|uniref:Ubiquitin-like domain-containing protein n=1 Tax=Peronospora belbahrii TaxID=622444 RepID=A0AAU9L2J1_9STRA|nr:unnamed protein product [Peronospora belbahrii]
MKLPSLSSSSLPTRPRAIGQRVDDGSGSLGTIRYIGPVATSKDVSALYYGIEWDEWGRGKNDGSVMIPNGDRIVYFQGPSGRFRTENETQMCYKCSFVKATEFDQFTRPSSCLLEQLQAKYDHMDHNINNSRPCAVDRTVTGHVRTTLGNDKTIELIGAKKLRTQQTLETIEKISLSGCQIVELGSMMKDGNRLGTLAPKLTELDLSRNLFQTWSDILAIIRELPLLETLILSGNRFICEDDSESQDSYDDIFETMKVLVLNQTLLHWNQVGKLVTRHFPKLEQLHLVGNEYVDDQLCVFQPCGSWTETLTVLDLSLNYLTSWERVLRTVGRMFVNLSQLMLNGNRIVTLEVEKDNRPITELQKLSTLSLSENLVDSWASIDELNAFPLLATLRFSKNPLTTQMSLGEARMLVVARTDHISIFNGSAVRDKERREAEQLYLKRILHELAAIGDDEKERKRVLAAHPRHTRLRELYPEIVVDQSGSTTGSKATAGSRKLASSLIKVSIIPMSMRAMSLEPLVKKIPQQMKVSQLKLLIETKLGIDVPSQLLSFRTDSRSMPELLDDDNSELSYYGMQNGSEVLVNDNE